ncbi:MAG: discoidin domain-containing protein, partial [Halobacteriaceae archaeon]
MSIKRIVSVGLVLMLVVTGSGVISSGLATSGDTAITQTSESTPIPASAMTAQASSWGSYSGTDRVPRKAVDGTDKTAWGGTRGAGDWLRIRLQTTYTLDRMVVDVGYHSLAYTVKASRDGESWRVIARDIRTPGNHHVGDESKTIEQIEVQNIRARYVKIKITSTNAPAGHIWQAIIEEVSLYGSKPTASQTTQSISPTPAPDTQAQSPSPTVRSSPSQAQSPAPESRLLLDSTSKQLGAVTLDGTTYYVVQYDNMLPYADGIEIYRADGTRLRSLARAKPVLEAIAARRVLAQTEATNVRAKARAVATGQATQTFKSLAWRRAARQLKPEDIATLRRIQQSVTDIKR